MLRGLTTINYFADDVEAATKWYSDLLETAPYFVRPEVGPPAYVEFRIGDYQHELGLIDSRYAPTPATDAAGGVVAYWAVDDVTAAFARLISLGATEHEAVTERGPGFVTASVIDPFGNILGVMYNAHYLEVLGNAS
ncbi:VOC family protein [Glaciibacter superstes]|uniref:VOC family protein n=1 Tax=Glaciibacter superstes TaxID=501023 RepID=UPI0003B6FE0B|nr:VOC family protein [Glaciibacter superstes]